LSETNNDIEISIVIPTYNSEEYIESSIRKIHKVLTDSGLVYEIIIVNDGSIDSTGGVLNSMLFEKFNFVKVVHLAKNYGQRIATCYGYYVARGNYVVTIDDDLQFCPKLILLLYNEIKLKENFVVSGIYEGTFNGAFYRSFKNLFLFLINNLFFVRYNDKGFFSSFKIYNKFLLSRKNIHNIYYFWRIPRQKISTFKVKKNERISGKSSYLIKGYFKTFSHVFAKIFLKSSVFIMFISLLMILFYKLCILIVFFIFLVFFNIAVIYLDIDINLYKNVSLKKKNE
jgi:glycosyltransferase involved in cell wall biosynthesis